MQPNSTAPNTGAQKSAPPVIGGAKNKAPAKASAPAKAKAPAKVAKQITPWLAPFPKCAQAKPISSLRVNKQTTATAKFVKAHKGVAMRWGRLPLYYDGLSFLDCGILAGLDALQLAFYVENGLVEMTPLSDEAHDAVVKAVADGSYQPAKRNGYKTKWTADAPDKVKTLGQDASTWLKG